MTIHIVGTFDKDKVYCTGSLTKLLTTYVSLCFLSEKFNLADIIDDDGFFDAIVLTPSAKEFLAHFHNLVGNHFSLHDICSYYAGLPYTFDPDESEIEAAALGKPFKHHAIPDEKTFLSRCKNNITPVYAAKSKFHYSEISILFLAYFLEINYDIKMEALYDQYIIEPFQLTRSQFSRKRVNQVHVQDLSDRYDYPSIAILDHGYFCYSNGFYTTLNDMKILLEHLLNEPIFKTMVDIQYARAASNRLMNGLTVELRQVNNDLIYGYEGLSFSGCNLWAYSTQYKMGFLTFNDSEEEVYTIIYDQLLGYSQFDVVADHTQKIYKQFIADYHDKPNEIDIPPNYQGNYQRVNINEKVLNDVFKVGKNYIVIRNPEEVRYDIINVEGIYRVKGKDNIHGAKVGFYQAKNGKRFMSYDGTLYLRRNS